MHGITLPEYRRGILEGAGRKLWHFNEGCVGYPLRNFAISKARPSDDELCSRCETLNGR
jgi:hypothetical protein